MRTKPAAFEPATETPADDWVLTIPLDGGRGIPGGVRLAEWGPFRCFFYGLLFDRGDLARWGNCTQLDCSDADLILRAYERAGEAILQRLRGSFVVAISDRARDIAIVARDQLGSHPLFYVETSSQVLFAVTPQPLLEYPGVSRALNRVALADHLCYRWPDPQETFFAAVRRVPPGWRAVISGGHLRLERYWDPTPEGRPVEWLAAEDVARFDQVFDRAVERCLGNGPTGIFLSGGLDSVSVAIVATERARRVGDKPPLALSLGFPDPECDERGRQAAVARQLGLQQHLVDFYEAIGSRPLHEQWLELTQEIDAPLLNPWQVPYLALAQRGRLEGGTILTGQGGDEWLTVSPYLSADLIRRGAFLELAKFFWATQRSYPLLELALARNMLWTCGIRPLIGLARHRVMPQIHRASRLRRLCAGDPVWVAPEPELRAEQRRRAEGAMPLSDPPQGFYLRELQRGLDHILVSWEPEEHYQVGKRIGVRFLHPFQDADLVEMLYRTPPHLLNQGGWTKGLVRQKVAGNLPGLEFENQRKVQSATFFQTVLFREGAAMAEQAGDFPALSALGIVNGQETRAFARGELRRGSSRIHQIWLAVIVEAWVRSHGG